MQDQEDPEGWWVGNKGFGRENRRVKVRNVAGRMKGKSPIQFRTCYLDLQKTSLAENESGLFVGQYVMGSQMLS